jgi:hypothetical protein
VVAPIRTDLSRYEELPGVVLEVVGVTTTLGEAPAVGSTLVVTFTVKNDEGESLPGRRVDQDAAGSTGSRGVHQEQARPVGRSEDLREGGHVFGDGGAHPDHCAGADDAALVDRCVHPDVRVVADHGVTADAHTGRDRHGLADLPVVGERNSSKYDTIGESDRMTLRFRKPN